MNIINIKVHKVNIASNAIDEIAYSTLKPDFSNYVNDIITFVLKGGKSRRYRFISDTSEIFTLVSRSIYNGKFDESIRRSSERLLAEEIKAQARIANLKHEIQKGILIQAHINDDYKDKFIICKADDTPYIDEINLTLSNGYPLKRKIFKSFITVFDADKSILSTDIYDPTSASYWHSDYLELEALLDDTENTIKTFEAIDNMIFSPMKKHSPNDHWELRNSLITSMKNNPAFDMNDYADEILSKYSPTSDKLDMQKIATKARELPKKYNFDSTFNLVSKAITAKIKQQVVPLTENIDLTIKDSINTSDTIIPFQGNDLTKYIMIKSDVGYDTFKKKDI